MKHVTLFLDESTIEDIQILVKLKKFPNRSEMIRHFIKKGIEQEYAILRAKDNLKERIRREDHEND